MKCEEAEIQISGYLDDELTQQESQKVRLHIESCTHCRKLHDELVSLRENMQQLSYPVSDEEMLDILERDLTAKTARSFGWVFVIIAGVVLFFIGLYGFLAAPGMPTIVKILYGLFWLGGLSLFASVARQRIMTYKNDKYRKVKL